jgi:hypothetical protein
MLEQMRRQGASIFIYFIFGLLIVIFVINFAPSNRGDLEGGCRSTSTAVTVDGNAVNNTAFLIAYQAVNSFLQGAAGRQRVYAALDYLTRRELLAQEAEERGIRTTTEQAQEAVKKGEFFLGGNTMNVRPVYFGVSSPDDDLYNHKKWKGWVGSLSVSEGSYLEEQARGLQAAMMNELLSGSARVSRDEALADYLYEQHTVMYDVVAFDPARYRPAMRLGEADIKRFLEGHGAEVEAHYKAFERTYKDVKPEVEIREIFIPKALPEATPPTDDKAASSPAKPDDKAAASAAPKADDKAAKADPKTAPAAPKADDKTAKADPKAAPAAPKADDKTAKADPKAAKADDAAKPADKKPAAGAPPKPYGLPTDVAKTKLEAVRAAIVAGKLTFPDAEKQLAADSSDDAPASNGYHGWRSVENAQLGDKAVNDAVKTLNPGEMTPVIVTDRGTYLVIALAKRQGDLSYDQVKNEIAATLAKDVWSKEAAKRDALDALAKAQAGTGKNLDQMFERELVRQPGSIEDILNNPDLTPEVKQQLLQQFLQREKQGSLGVREVDVPVAWFADADGSGTPGAGAGTPAAGGTAAPAAAGSSTAAPAAGSSTTAPAPAAGSSTAPAAGGASGAGAGSAAAPPAPPAPTTIEPSKEVLPAFGNVPAAKVNRLGPSPRQPKMPGIGGSKEAIDALFDELSPGNLAKKVYAGDNSTYVVIQLINRAQPSAEEFDKIADVEIARMQDARGRAAVRDWLKNRCETLSKAGKIRPAPDRIRETDDKGNPAPTVYHPCMYFDFLDR